MHKDTKNINTIPKDLLETWGGDAKDVLDNWNKPKPIAPEPSVEFTPIKKGYDTYKAIQDKISTKQEPNILKLIDDELKVIEAKNKENNRIEKELSNPNTENVLSNSIFEALPDLLKEPTLKFISQSEREVFLVSALGVVSGMLPNVIGRYDGRDVYSNLYVYLIGKYGTGKGTQVFARMIAQVTHKELRENSSQAESRYKADLLEYEELKKKKLPAEQPIEPKQLNLIVPANISTAGLLQLMADNDGRGIIIESETDTMTNANNNDFSDSSSIYRANFHHENISNYRKTGKEYSEIEKPQLSVVLTSTHDQLIRFIPNYKNGLFSRFLFYDMKSSREFKDVFDERQNDFPEYFKDLGEKYQGIYTYLIALEEPIIFDYTPTQKTKLVSEFRLLKADIGEYVSEDLDGTVNRLGLICFRISMIFATLRAFSDGEVSAKIVCQDIDFNNAFRIVRILLKHAIEIYFTMPKTTEYVKEETVFDDAKSNLIRQAKLMKAQNVPLRKIALDLLGSESKKDTISRMLQK